MKRFKRGDVVEVLWFDAFCRQGWHNGPTSKKIEVDPYKVRSVGIYQGRDKQYITVSQSTADGKDADNTLCVPNGMIKKVRKLK